jgi:hypothetical protein
VQFVRLAASRKVGAPRGPQGPHARETSCMHAGVQCSSGKTLNTRHGWFMWAVSSALEANSETGSKVRRYPLTCFCVGAHDRGLDAGNNHPQGEEANNQIEEIA